MDFDHGISSVDVRWAAPARPGDLVLRAGGGCLVLASLTLPWVEGRAGSTIVRLAGRDLTASRWVIAGLALAAVVLVVVERLPRRATSSRFAPIAVGVVLAVTPLLVILIAETAAVWLAPERVPSTLRRLAVGVVPQPGLWIAALGGAACLAGAVRLAGPAWAAVRKVVDGVQQREASSLGTAIVAVGILGTVAGRYGSWLQISSTAGDWDVPGWSIPWFGVFTLVAVLATAVAAATYAWQPRLGAASLVLVLGWAVTFPAALSITASAIGTVRAPEWVRTHLDDASAAVSEVARTPEAAALFPGGLEEVVDVPDDLAISVGVGRGAVAVFCSGLATALAGFLMALASTRRRRPA